MRKIGEQNLAVCIRSSGEQRYIMSRWKSMARKRIAVKCVDCGSDELVKEGVFYKFYKEKPFRCFGCGTKKREQDKIEMNQALINLAKNKKGRR